MARRVLVLGSGVCGLAAAWRLLERDPQADVTLLEAEDRPGGLARSLTLNGHVSDLGPHRIFTELEDVRTFLSDVAGDAMREVRRESRMWLAGRWIEYPPKPAEILALLGPFRLAGAAASYAAGKAAKVARRAAPPESFESLMVDAFGPSLYEFLVGPYTQKVWKVPPATIHADIARVRVSAGGLDQMVKRVLRLERDTRPTALKSFHYIPGGVEQLVLKMLDGVRTRGGELRLRHRVLSVAERGDGVEVRALDESTQREETFTADAVVSTIPLPDLLAMLLRERADATAARRREELRFVANFLVCIAARKREFSTAQWLYFPQEDTLFNRGYEPRNFDTGMAREGEAMLVLEVTSLAGDAISAMSDEELTDRCIEGLGHVGLLRREELIATLVHRIPHTYPLYDLDYRPRLEELIAYLGNFPRVVSTGRQGLFLHNNMDHSIHMGFRAAEALVAEPSNPAAMHYRELRTFQQFRIVD